MTLDNILVAASALQADDTFGFELPNNRDDLVLRALYIPDPHGAEGVDIIFEHLYGAGRHGAEEVIFEAIAGALQGEGERLAVNSGEDFFQLIDIDGLKIFKHKHQLADGLHQIRVVIFDDVRDEMVNVSLQSGESSGNLCTQVQENFKELLNKL